MAGPRKWIAQSIRARNVHPVVMFVTTFALSYPMLVLVVFVTSDDNPWIGGLWPAIGGAFGGFLGAWWLRRRRRLTRLP